MTDDVAQSYLVSPAWLIGGVTNVPGYLAGGLGRLAFVSDTPVFDVPMDQVTDITWPWYLFGGGFTARVGGQLHKVTFVRPNGMPAQDTSMSEAAVGVLGALSGAGHDVSALRGLADVGTGRAAGKRWRQYLGA